MTLLVREPAMVRPMGHVPLLVGWSVVRALGSTLPWQDLDLKWPNDILLQGKKIGGVLCSVSIKAGQTWLSLGIGINVGDMAFPEELSSIATTMAHHSTATFSVLSVAQAIVDGLEEDLERLTPDELLKNFQGKSSICFNQEISYLEQGREASGFTCGLDEEGALRCRSASGEIRSLHVSEVHRVKRV